MAYTTPSMYCKGCKGYFIFSQRQNLTAQCSKCEKEEKICTIIANSLSNEGGIGNKLFPAHYNILRALKIAPIYVNDFKISYNTLEVLKIDINKYGIPEEARILSVDITDQFTCKSEYEQPTLMELLKREKKSSEDLSHELFLYAVSKAFREGGDLNQSPFSAKVSKFEVDITVRYQLPGEIFEEHIIEAAKAYGRNDDRSLIYNCFAAFELRLSKLLEVFWLQKVGKDEYECLTIEKASIEKKMDVHLKLMTNTLNIDYKI